MPNPAITAWPSGLALLIPAYQAGATLPSVLSQVLAQVPADAVMVVDDGSSDNTSAIARSRGVTVHRHLANRGKGTALATGLLALHKRGFGWAITLDADGQHRVDDLPQFLASNPAQDVGIIVGQRPVRGTNMPWHRKFSNLSTTYVISRMAKQDVFDAQSGFRLYRTALMANGVWPAEGRFEWEAQALILCHRAGWRIASVPIRTVYAGEGSHMRLVADTLRFLRMVGRLAWTR